MTAYFLSDIHLSTIEEPNTHRLLSFLRSIRGPQDATHLFLLGDIFDLWVAGHYYFVQKYSTVIEELRRLQAAGVEIHYFEGNHDLYLEHFFGHELGLKIHSAAEYFQLGRFRVRLEHGDQMDPFDRGYIFLRKLLRTRFMQWLAPRLPSGFVVWLGERMSHSSRKYTSAVKTISTDRAVQVIHMHAMRAFVEQPFDFLICGHVHVKEDYALPDSDNARVINLGSWFDGAYTLKLTDGGPEWVGL